MAYNIYKEIQLNVSEKLMRRFIDTDIYYDNIKITSQRSYIFVDLISFSLKTLGKNHVKRRITLDIIVYMKEYETSDYFEVIKNLDDEFRPVLEFDGRYITIDNVDARVVDGVLHYMFELEFVDTSIEQIDSDLMSSLSLKQGE